MDIIEMTRKLGAAIQEDDRYVNYRIARDANDNDQELQRQIGEFNLLRMRMNEEISRDEKDESKIGEINRQMKDCYADIMASEGMIRYNEAKEAFDMLMAQVNGIISMTVNGDDPETCDPSGCGGSCASCAGCS